jgi:glycosyltransferase involved in cell wall biosynthesis
MRIAHALQMPIYQQGGVEVLVRELIKTCASPDECLLVSSDTEADLQASDIANHLAGHLQAPLDEPTREWNQSLRDWVKRERVDIVHFHLPGTYGWLSDSWHRCPITLLGEGGTPVVCTNHQAVSFFDRSRPPVAAWRKWAATARRWPGKARQLRAVRWEASVSKNDLDVSRRGFPGFNHKLLQIYHSRLDANAVLPQAFREQSILNVATIAFRKGQHILVEAFARIADRFPDWKLDLVGYTAEAACLQAIEDIRQSSGLSDRIRLHGPHPDPTSFYQTAGIYVQPSLLEGLGLSLQEAMFYEIPSVGADCGGIPELIADPSIGRLFHSGDSTSLANVLSQLIVDQELRALLGSAGRTSILARGMTRQAMTESYRNLYHHTLHLS